VTGDVVVITCLECGTHADADAHGWEGHLADLDDDGEDEVAFSCPDCVAREFGE
jgi:hypothetical protein